MGRCRTRKVRRYAKSLDVISLSAAHPINPAGIATRGATVPRRRRVLYFDGVPVASKHGREVHMSDDLAGTTVWEACKALLRRGVGASRLSLAAGGIVTTP